MSAAARARSSSGSRSPSKYKLREGADFDAMGAEVYKDEFIRIVASGGIPIYTGVGYTGDAFAYSLPPEAVCAPGKGLKTFDAVFRDLLKEDKMKEFTAGELETIAKSFLNDDPLTTENIGKIKSKHHLAFDDSVWLRTNKIEKRENRLEARLKMMNSTRSRRMMLDPLYSTHIYFRAPSVWPRIESGGKIALRPDLKGCFLPDYHFFDDYDALFAGAEFGEKASFGVVVNVDPNNSYVFNSEARPHNVTGEIIYGGKMTLSEYLIKLRDCGIEYVLPEMELYISPPDGVFPSEKFNGCITDITSHKVTLKNFITGEKSDIELEKRSPQMERLRRIAGWEFSKKTLPKQHEMFYGKISILSFLSYYNEWSEQNVPSTAGKLFRSAVMAAKRTLQACAPYLEKIKALTFPFYSDALGVIHEAYLDKLAVVDAVMEDLKKQIDMQILFEMNAMGNELNFSVLFDDFMEKYEELVGRAFKKEELDSMLAEQTVTTLKAITDPSMKPKAIAILNKLASTKMFLIIKNLGEMYKKLPELVVSIEKSIGEVPAWFPPPDVIESINVSSINVSAPSPKTKANLAKKELEKFTKKREKALGPLEAELARVMSKPLTKRYTAETRDAELAKVREKIDAVISTMKMGGSRRRVTRKHRNADPL